MSWLAELAKQQVLDIREDFATRRCNERFGAVLALDLELRLQKGFKARAVTDTHVGIIVVPFESGCSDVPASSMLGGFLMPQAGVYQERVNAVPALTKEIACSQFRMTVLSSQRCLFVFGVALVTFPIVTVVLISLVIAAWIIRVCDLCVHEVFFRGSASFAQLLCICAHR